jgi:hypothetical protein
MGSFGAGQAPHKQRDHCTYLGTNPALSSPRDDPPHRASDAFEAAMSSHAHPIRHPFAVAGLVGFGAVLGARVVIPIVSRWAQPHSEASPLLAVCAEEELDRWANEGGCCALSREGTHGR